MYKLYIRTYANNIIQQERRRNRTYMHTQHYVATTATRISANMKTNTTLKAIFIHNCVPDINEYFYRRKTQLKLIVYLYTYIIINDLMPKYISSTILLYE